MRKVELKCIVKHFNVNKQKIEDINILQDKEALIKQLKKVSGTKNEFALRLKSEFRYRYWGKCEWELILVKTDDGKMLLKPFIGNRGNVVLDVTNDSEFDWDDIIFSVNGKGNEIKIDAYSQIMHGDKFDKLVSYLWTTLFPYERNDPKFKEENE